MKINRILTTILALCTVLAVSCKKEEETSSSLSFDGVIKLSLPAYLDKNAAVTFDIDTMVTLSRSDEQGSNVGYYISNPTTGKKDTIYYDGHILNEKFPDAVYTFIAPSSLKTATLMLVGFSDGYYERSASVEFTTVDARLDGTGSLTGFSHITGQGVYVDPRDGVRYYTVKAGDQEWMRSNLAWKGAGVAYANADAMSRIYGRFYTWEEAQTACPQGWRLPSESDWSKLALTYGIYDSASRNYNGVAPSLMEEISFNGVALWEYWPNVKINNASGLSMFPCGYARQSSSGYEFRNDNYYAMFWTSDEEDGDGVYRYICEDKDILYHGCTDKTSFAVNVRCVR